MRDFIQSDFRVQEDGIRAEHPELSTDALRKFEADERSARRIQSALGWCFLAVCALAGITFMVLAADRMGWLS